MKKLLALLFAFLLIGTLAACDAIIDIFPQGTPDPAPMPSFTPPIGFPELNPELGSDLEFTIVTDLPEINLIYHDLEGSDLLEPIMLQTLLGIDVALVTIITTYDELVQEGGWIVNDAWAIELYYFARRHETAVQSLKASFAGDVEAEWIFPDSHLEIGDIRATEDHQMAFLAVIEELTNGVTRILLYMAQNVPDSNDVVILDVVLYPHLWEGHDDVVLYELSGHIGLDLREYLTQFLMQDAAVEL